MRGLFPGAKGVASALAVALIATWTGGFFQAEEGDTRDAGERETSSHVLIGVSPASAFSVVVDGEPVPGGPFSSGVEGIVEFDIDDSGLPSGPHTVLFAPVSQLIISGVEHDSVTVSSVVVRWQTSLPATSAVEYGPTAGYGQTTATNPALTTSHEIRIDDLATGTLYHFRAVSGDGAGQTAYSGDHTFETLQSPLAVSDVEVLSTGPTWALVAWTTNRPATSLVQYGLTEFYTDTTVENMDLETDHSVLIDGLDDGTLYHFRTLSREGELGEVAVSDDHTFTTMEVEPTGPPVIGDVVAGVESLNSVVIAWTTDRAATSQVCFGIRGELDSETACDTTLTTEHTVCLRPVTPMYEYSFVVLSACGADTSVSERGTFRTELPPESTATGRCVTRDRVGIVDLGVTSVTLGWATDRPCSTWVEYGAGIEFEQSAPGSIAGDLSHEATLVDLDAATRYRYRICAWDALGGIVVGDAGVFETPISPDNDPPAAPGGLEADVRNAAVELAWLPCDEEDLLGSYVYRMDVEPTGDGVDRFEMDRAQRLNGLPLAESGYVDCEVEVSLTYVYAVTAVDTAGNESEPSEGVALIFHDAIAHVSLSVYPNPSFGHATLSFAAPVGDNVSACIYSAAGRLVRRMDARASGVGTDTLTWDGRDGVDRPVGTGVYLCELTTSAGTARRKLTVIR